MVCCTAASASDIELPPGQNVDGKKCYTGEEYAEIAKMSIVAKELSKELELTEERRGRCELRLSSAERARDMLVLEREGALANQGAQQEEIGALRRRNRVLGFLAGAGGAATVVLGILLFSVR